MNYVYNALKYKELHIKLYLNFYEIFVKKGIMKCLDLFGVAENIKSLLVNSIEKWKVMLCSGNSELGEVEIKRGIFQGDSLSPFSVCFSTDLIKFDFKKGEGRI